MSQAKLKTAVLGLADEGRQLLAAAAQSEQFEVVAAADADAELAEKTAQRYSCEAFDDYRQLVIRSELDVLAVAAPMHQCDEHLRAAMKKKFNILKIIPPALDFEQAAELIKLAKSENIRYAVADSGRFRPGFSKLADYLESQNAKDFHLITGVCNLQVNTDEPHQRWLSDPQLAGGGVLLRNCYELIGLIVRYFGMPQQVYCASTNQAPDKQQRLSITEDTVIFTMKFSDTLVANLVASRVFGPPTGMLKIHTKDGFLTASGDNFILYDNLGNIAERFEPESTETDATAKMLKTFADGLLSSDKNDFVDSENDNLNVMAVIEAAYLSARTAMPEEPVKVLEMVKA
ncbi:MAG: Gfo/Idh/MocA family protein [Planctomycetota bacterium]|jgi:predicted dehydrogenase